MVQSLSNFFVTGCRVSNTSVIRSPLFVFLTYIACVLLSLIAPLFSLLFLPPFLLGINTTIVISSPSISHSLYILSFTLLSLPDFDPVTNDTNSLY